MTSKRFVWLFLPLLFLLNALVLFAAYGQDTLVVVQSSEPGVLDTLWEQTSQSRRIGDQILEPLARFDPETDDVIPWLALSWEVLDGSKRWRFHLREDVSFSSGEPFNAQSVAFTIRQLNDPDYASTIFFFVSSLRGAETNVIDEYTVDVILANSDPTLDRRLPFLHIVPAGYFGQVGPEGFGQRPIGTGPYVLDSWEKGQHIVLAANSNYWGPTPKWNTVTYLWRSEAVVRLAMVQSGEVDIAFTIPPALANLAPKVVATVGEEVFLLPLNPDLGLTKSLAVRRALNYAVDKEFLLDSLLLGYGELGHGQPFSRKTYGYDPTIDDYPYDPQKARELLEEAGAVGGTITFMSSYEHWLLIEEMSEAVTSMWEEVGLNVELELNDWGTFLEKLRSTTPQANVNFVLHGNALGDAGITYESYWHQDGTFTSWKDPLISALVNEAVSETDYARKLELYHFLNRHANLQAMFVYGPGVANVDAMAANIEWDVPLSGQLFVEDVNRQQ